MWISMPIKNYKEIKWHFKSVHKLYRMKDMLINPNSITHNFLKATIQYSSINSSHNSAMLTKKQFSKNQYNGNQLSIGKVSQITRSHKLHKSTKKTKQSI